MYTFERKAEAMLDSIMERLRDDFIQNEVDEVHVTISAEGAGERGHYSYSASTTATLVSDEDAEALREGVEAEHPAMSEEQMRDVSVLRPKR